MFGVNILKSFGRSASLHRALTQDHVQVAITSLPSSVSPKHGPEDPKSASHRRLPHFSRISYIYRPGYEIGTYFIQYLILYNKRVEMF